jgi:hypothetical protein
MNCLSFIIGLINIFVALISMLIGFITIIDSILFNSNVNIHFLVLIMNRTYSNETRNETNNEIAVKENRFKQYLEKINIYIQSFQKSKKLIQINIKISQLSQ